MKISQLRFCLPLVLLALSACNQQGSGASPTGPQGDHPGDTSNPTPNQPEAPRATDLWKARRAQYQLLTRNGVSPCTSAERCLVWADRADADYEEAEVTRAIPQLVAWNLIVSQSEYSTVSVSIPIFADRGTTVVRDGVLYYDFSGRVHRQGAGVGDLTVHAELTETADKKISLAIDASMFGEGLKDTFVLQKIEGTDLPDAPADLKVGVIAVREIGSTNGYYQGIRCTVSFVGNSSFVLRADIDLIINQEVHPYRGMRMRTDEGLFALLRPLWTSHGNTTPGPADARQVRYYGVFAPGAEKPLEIPVSGDGVRVVTNDAPESTKSAFIEKIDQICKF